MNSIYKEGVNVKIKIITLFLIFITFINLPNENKKAHATWGVADTNIESLSVIIETKLAPIQRGIQTANQYIQIAKVAEQVSKGDLSGLQSQINSSQILKRAESINKLIQTTKSAGINIATQGKNIISDPKLLRDANAKQALNKTIANLKKTVYTNDIKKNLILTERNKDNNTFTLPYVIRDEICNSNKLKKTIENGYSGLYSNKKPVDFSNTKFSSIDNLCLGKTTTNNNWFNKFLSLFTIKSYAETENEMPVDTQTAFITLAENNYAGPKSRLAAAAPNNTPSGQINLAKDAVSKSRLENEDAIEKLTDGGVVGNILCINKDGETVKLNPAQENDPNNFCDRFTQDPKFSSAKIKADMESSAKAFNDAKIAAAAAASSTLSAEGAFLADVFGIDPEGLTSMLGTIDDVQKSAESLQETVSGVKDSYGAIQGTITDLKNLEKDALGLGEKFVNVGEDTNKKIGGIIGGNLSTSLAAYDEMNDLNAKKISEYKLVISLANKIIAGNNEIPTLKSKGFEFGCPKKEWLVSNSTSLAPSPVDEKEKNQLLALNITYTCNDATKTISLTDDTGAKKETDYATDIKSKMNTKLESATKDISQNNIDKEKLTKIINALNADTSGGITKNYESNDAVISAKKMPEKVLEAKRKWSVTEISDDTNLSDTSLMNKGTELYKIKKETQFGLMVILDTVNHRKNSYLKIIGSQNYSSPSGTTRNQSENAKFESYLIENEKEGEEAMGKDIPIGEFYCPNVKNVMTIAAGCFLD